MISIPVTRAIELADRLYELSSSDTNVTDRMLKLRQILEQLYKGITETTKISFNGLFARMQYANDSINLSHDLQSQSNQLRILCNKIAHDEVSEISPHTFDTSMQVIDSLLRYFCPSFEHKQLAEYLSSRNIKPFVPMKESLKTSFLCVVESWDVNKDERGEVSLAINAILEDGTSCHILLVNDSKQAGHDGRIYTQLNKSIWKYACLHCHELSSVSGREGFYQSNPHTIVVLEPDFLVDASAIAECFDNSIGNPAYFILNRLFSESSTEAMLQGLVVNSILDELVFTPKEDYLELFKHSLASMPIAFVSLGKDTAKRIYDKVLSEHLPQLQSYLSTIEDEEILLEPSYICPEYGLQGRLDMLRKKDDKYSIVELKSGKSPHIDVWKGHHMQTIAYNMIIRSVYRADRISSSSILYSQSKDNPVRHVVNIAILEQDLLMCRNRILGIMHLLTEDPGTFFKWLRKNIALPASQHMQAKLLRFNALIDRLTDYEYEWLLEQVKRIVREIWFVKTGDNGSRSESSLGHNALWQQGEREKQAAYKIIVGLQPISYNKKQISFSIPPSDEIADFREGDIVVLYRMDAKIYKQEMLRGIITQLDETHLEISIRGGLRNSRRLSKDSSWAIEHDTLETSLYSPLASLTNFLSSDTRTRNLMLGISIPETDENTHGDNEHTLETILKRMHAAKEIYIVQGPPGTGKTSGLLGTYVKQVYEQSQKCIFILSFTNRAVDEICMCLLRNNIPFLRMGNSSVIHEQLLSTQIEGKRFEEMEKVVRDNRIWISTVQSANAWYQDMLRIVKIDEVIIDEASQIIENSILGLVAKAPKTIMIGDQNQLPPISVQSSLPYVFTHPELQNLHYSSYHQSLMERLHNIYHARKCEGSIAMLRKHFRMHDNIAGLIGHYYHDQLISATAKQKEAFPANKSLPDFLNYHSVWISTPAGKTSHFDQLQVELIVLIIQKLIQAKAVDNASREIGIVAPFRAMIHALRKAILPIEAAITIDTVERFQGSERENIILCLPLKGESDLRLIESVSDDGFIDRKLNVALSRAQQRIIVIGNPDICRKSIHYHHLIELIAVQGMIIDAADAIAHLQPYN
ncbi:MAG: hypothetical protein CVU50_08165 [Candidatus Cloacimonetes bacterium HGW-Cloacimonetes-3]|nr:MAG: hypothetical protein CVU50_08165 [Candidatus Cloacimonetes bacterium HGW-Cloacimonetes-3]